MSFKIIVFQGLVPKQTYRREEKERKREVFLSDTHFSHFNKLKSFKTYLLINYQIL